MVQVFEDFEADEASVVQPRVGHVVSSGAYAKKNSVSSHVLVHVPADSSAA